MNFHDAMAAMMDGKTIRRLGRVVIPMPDLSDFHYAFTRDEIAATDWEIHEPKVSITAKDLKAAWEKLEKLNPNSHFLTDLTKELGL